eukprot:8271262-Pyramimonas_sp.AAC.1
MSRLKCSLRHQTLRIYHLAALNSCNPKSRCFVENQDGCPEAIDLGHGRKLVYCNAQEYPSEGECQHAGCKGTLGVLISAVPGTLGTSR